MNLIYTILAAVVCIALVVTVFDFFVKKIYTKFQQYEDLKFKGADFMITIFNRKLLITIMDMKRQADIRYKLESAHIDYVVRTKNQKSSEWFGSGNRGRYGSMGINTNYSYEYKIYVHKNDYEKALHVIR